MYQHNLPMLLLVGTCSNPYHYWDPFQQVPLLARAPMGTTVGMGTMFGTDTSVSRSIGYQRVLLLERVPTDTTFGTRPLLELVPMGTTVGTRSNGYHGYHCWYM